MGQVNRNVLCMRAQVAVIYYLVSDKSRKSQSGNFDF